MTHGSTMALPQLLQLVRENSGLGAPSCLFTFPNPPADFRAHPGTKGWGLCVSAGWNVGTGVMKNAAVI